MEVFVYQPEKSGEPMDVPRLISVVNKTAFEYFKGRIADFIGTELKSLGDIIHYSEVVSNLRQVLDKVETMQGEMSFRLRSNGEEQWILVDYAKIIEESVFEIAKEITARKQVEDE